MDDATGLVTSDTASVENRSCADMDISEQSELQVGSLLESTDVAKASNSSNQSEQDSKSSLSCDVLVRILKRFRPDNQPIIESVRKQLHQDDQALHRLSIIVEIIEQLGMDAPTLRSEAELLKCMDDSDLETEALKSVLCKDCCVCLTKVTVHSLVPLLYCECRICVDCFKFGYGTQVNNSPMQSNLLSCVSCSKPDNALESDDHVQFMLNQFRLHLPAQLEKIEERVLHKSLEARDEFIWCNKCGNGFLTTGGSDISNPRSSFLAITCNNCRLDSCMYCKQAFDKKHLKRGCPTMLRHLAKNEFLTGRKTAKPKIIAAATKKPIQLTAQLTSTTLKTHALKLTEDMFLVRCPACKVQIEVSGGCLHMTCVRCNTQFCVSCRKSFYLDSVSCRKCRKLQSHGNKPASSPGLHAHHPRDCFYFLRDFPLKALMQFVMAHLTSKSTLIKYLEHYVGMYGSGSKTLSNKQYPKHYCHIVEQCEGTGADAVCGQAVDLDHSRNMCDAHLKTVLTRIIHIHKLDPAELYSMNGLRRIVERDADKVSEKIPTGNVKNVLVNFVKRNIPL